MNTNILDINSFIANIKNILSECEIVADTKKQYYGRITICFENGKMSHIEKHETIK